MDHTERARKWLDIEPPDIFDARVADLASQFGEAVNEASMALHARIALLEAALEKADVMTAAITHYEKCNTSGYEMLAAADVGAYQAARAKLRP